VTLLSIVLYWLLSKFLTNEKLAVLNNKFVLKLNHLVLIMFHFQDFC